MGRSSLTRDEVYLMKLAELMKDSFEEIDAYVVGRAIGQNSRSVDNMIRMLAQTNFLRKGEGNMIYLTQHGLDLVESLRNS